MAATSATVTVNFISNYVGVHRACYRYGNLGSYTCLNVTCAGNGASCSINLPVVVDNETCQPLQIQGYVQAACQDVNSSVDRVPFVVDFTPTPTCLKYNFTCQSVGVLSATITNNGTNYGSAPTVTIVGGGGSGATAVAILGNGGVKNATLTFAGVDYTAPNGIYIVALVGGAGTGATAQVTLSGGTIIAMSVTYPTGTGYNTGDVLNPDTGVLGVPVSPATISVISNARTVVAVNITNQGIGYTSVPVIVIGLSPDVSATATAVLDTCSTLTTVDCQGNAVNIPNGSIALGQSVSTCKVGTPPVAPSGYTVVANGNCPCTGINVTIGATGTAGSTMRYSYNKTNGLFVEGVLMVGGSPATINDCAVNGSVLTKNLGATPVVTYGSPC